jgi:hypothetical protein
MQSKYKVQLLRGYLLMAGLGMAWLAHTAPDLPEAMLLGLASGWLCITAIMLDFSHRRPAMVPWQLLPSLLLAALIWLAPERYQAWLWAWALLIMLPQPPWMGGVNAFLAGMTWWSLAAGERLPLATITGVLLAGLMTLGLARHLELQGLRAMSRHRVRLIPGLHLWSNRRLLHDLPIERARTQREGIHAELVLIRTSLLDLWPLAQRLCQFSRSFENCYRLNRRTLALILIDRNAEQAEHRRKDLLTMLGNVRRFRASALSRVESLGDEIHAMNRQHAHVMVIREFNP